jgi:hypothetical protein
MSLERNAGQLIVIVNGRGRRAAVPAVPVVPQSLSCTPVTRADPGPALSSYGMNAAFMSFQPNARNLRDVTSWLAVVAWPAWLGDMRRSSR